MHVVLQVVNALPRALRPGAVIHPEDQPGDGLDDERKGDRRGPDEPPRRAAGNGPLKPVAQRGEKAGALIEPMEQGFHDGELSRLDDLLRGSVLELLELHPDLRAVADFDLQAYRGRAG